MNNKNINWIFIIGSIQILVGCQVLLDIYLLPLFIFAILGLGIIGLRIWARSLSVACWSLFLLGNILQINQTYDLWKGIGPTHPLLKLTQMLVPSVLWISLSLFMIVFLTRPAIKEQFTDKNVVRLNKSLFAILMVLLLALIPLRMYLPYMGKAKSTRQENAVFVGRHNFEFNNMILLIVEAGKNQCVYEHRYFDSRDGLTAPYEELDLSFDTKKFKVTDAAVGNNYLKVNNVMYKVVGGNQHLLIDQDGKIRPEAGQVHSSVQFLSDTCPTCKKLNEQQK